MKSLNLMNLVLVCDQLIFHPPMVSGALSDEPHCLGAPSLDITKPQTDQKPENSSNMLPPKHELAMNSNLPEKHQELQNLGPKA